MAIADTLAELASDITNAYDKINDKGGTIPANKNTNNLATAIDTISTGVTPTGTINITQNGTVDVTNYATADVQVVDNRMKGYIEGTLTVIDDDTVTSVRQYALRTSLIQTLSLPNATSISINAFNGMSSLINVYIPQATSLPLQCFNTCNSLVKACFQKVTSISTYVFGSSSRLAYLIFEVNQVVSLSNNNAFNGTPLNNAYGSATGGTLYVPYSQVANYESNGTWNPKTNGVPNYNRTFKSIQENLAELQALDVYKFELSDYYEIVSEKPVDPTTDKTYLIATATPNEYTQHHFNGTAWNDSLPNITLT